jgi:hypothetical protein
MARRQERRNEYTAADALRSAAGGGGAPESWEYPGDGTDLTDLGGTGGDITGDWNDGKLEIVGSPVHGVFTQQSPESGKFTFSFTWITNHASSAHIIGGINLLNNQNERRLGSYAASEGNPQAGDRSIILVLNGGKGAFTGITGNLLALQRQEGTTYNEIAVYAGGVASTTRLVDIHVDLNGGNPLVSVDIDEVEVIAQAEMGAGDGAFGRNMSLYIEGSGDGSTPLAGNTLHAFAYTEVE